MGVVLYKLSGQRLTHHADHVTTIIVQAHMALTADKIAIPCETRLIGRMMEIGIQGVVYISKKAELNRMFRI